ncbi:DUF6409 family protein [Actinacidiphila glaucinigra]|uniref:DUF6409 family protein n=1 Tax=Actinacidiphila glaucinigra TaxID=235986 RepID=UPI0033B2530F
MTSTQDTAYKTGDLIQGRPVKNGEPQAPRRGVVLGLFKTDPSCGYLVWWHGKGPASMSTVSLMFARELRRTGSVEDLSLGALTRMERGARAYNDAAALYRLAGTHRFRKRSARTTR